MKKFLAILLALTLVLANVAVALAGETGGDNGSDTAITDQDSDKDNNEGGGTSNNATSTTPAAETKATEKDPSVAIKEGDAYSLEATKVQKVKINKHFNVSGTGAKTPAQTVEFTFGTGDVSNSTTVTTAPSIDNASVTFAEGDKSKEVEITLPSFSGVGIYTYPVTETDTGIAGEKYASDLELKVTVIQNGDKLMIGGIALRQKNVKTDTLENDYNANALTVGKTVSGNMGDTTKLFPITVVLTAPEGDKVFGTVGVTITGDKATVKVGSTEIKTEIAAETAGWTTKTLSLQLANGDTVKFDNLPEGVTYTVVEDEAITHTAATQNEAEQANPDAYYVENEVETATALTADATVTISNTKTVEIDTGVTLETVPYIMILAVTMIGAALLVIRKREEY